MATKRGNAPKKVQIADVPMRRVEPADVAAALGATETGQRVPHDFDPIALAELGTQLLSRLRSSGGRPALTDATHFCRVPISEDDLRSLEALVDEMRSSIDTKPSIGQLISAIVHRYLTEMAANNRPANVPEMFRSDSG
jgi:hypothetical protein